MCKKSKTQVEREIEPFTILHNKEVSEIGLKSFVLFLIILPPFEIIDFGSPSRGHIKFNLKIQALFSGKTYKHKNRPSIK